MKKILAIILSLATAVLTSVGFSACNREYDPIEYTAEKPIVMDSEDIVNRIPQSQKITRYWEFDKFKDYYNENLNGNGLYLLNYGFEVRMEYHIDYEIYKDLKTNQFIIREGFEIYDPELGCPPYDVFTEDGHMIAGYYPVSLYLRIYIQPVESKIDGDFRLEFGKRTIDDGKYVNDQKYINIYQGEECFATCYYGDTTRNGYIEREWFENYFKENLIWGDTYEN